MILHIAISKLRRTDRYILINRCSGRSRRESTPFEHETYDAVLTKCHRYCFTSHRYGEGNISMDAGGSTRMHGAVYGTGAASFVRYEYPRIMRTIQI